MDENSSQGLLGDSLRTPGTRHASHEQHVEQPEVRAVRVSHQRKDGLYNSLSGTEAAYPSSAPLSPDLSTDVSPGPFKSLDEVKSFNHMKSTDTILKHRIRLLKFLLRLASFLLALYMIVAMSLTLRKYFSTRNYIITVEGPNGPMSRGPWAIQTKVWPTTVLLVTSVLSFLVSALVMVAYTQGVRAANAAHEYGSYLSFAIFSTHLGLWIAVAAAYRAGKDGNDLWGWTCDVRALRIQPAFERVINFRRYCDIQTGSWITSLAQAAVLLLYVVVYAWGYVRLRNQRDMSARFTNDVYEHREGVWSRFIPTKH